MYIVHQLLCILCVFVAVFVISLLLVSLCVCVCVCVFVCKCVRTCLRVCVFASDVPEALVYQREDRGFDDPGDNHQGDYETVPSELFYLPSVICSI